MVCIYAPLSTLLIDVIHQSTYTYTCIERHMDIVMTYVYYIIFVAATRRTRYESCLEIIMHVVHRQLHLTMNVGIYIYIYIYSSGSMQQRRMIDII